MPEKNNKTKKNADRTVQQQMQNQKRVNGRNKGYSEFQPHNASKEALGPNTDR